MTDHPVRVAWAAGTHPGISHAEEQYFPFVAMAVSDINTRSLDRVRVVHLMKDGYYSVYHYDPTNVDAEDGVNVILDSDDRPFVLRGSGYGVLSIHAAGAFADRTDYDAEESPRADGSLFIFLSTDGDGASITDAVLFAKLSDSASWSDPIQIRGETGGDVYEIGNWDSDRPAAAEELYSWIFTRSVTFPAGLTASQAKARMPSTGTAVYSIRKNDVQVGTLTFTASATGVFAMASQQSFVAGDRLTVVAPDPRDATLSGVVITLAGTR
jgi:hypothetical protein